MNYKPFLILAGFILIPKLLKAKKMGENISDHISYNEGTRSATAIKNVYDNTPSAEHLKNMKNIALNVFEPLRNHFNKPIKIESFYRSEKVNAKTPGASSNSQHMKGQAIDIDSDFGGLTNAEMFNYIKNNLSFDQLIWEFGTDKEPGWVHVSYVSPVSNRKKITRSLIQNGKTVYVNF
jgi:hypothetical protein